MSEAILSMASFNTVVIFVIINIAAWLIFVEGISSIIECLYTIKLYNEKKKQLNKEK